MNRGHRLFLLLGLLSSTCAWADYSIVASTDQLTSNKLNQCPANNAPDPQNGQASISFTNGMDQAYGSLPLTPTPMYSNGSLSGGPQSAWGIGWSSDADQYLVVGPSSATWMLVGGGQLSYLVRNIVNGVPSFTLPVNSYSTMTATGFTGSLPSGISIRDPDGTVYTFTAYGGASIRALHCMGWEPILPRL